MRLARVWKARRGPPIAWALLLALIPVAVVGMALYSAYRQASAELLIERNRQLAYLSAARLEDEFLGFAAVLTSLARTPEVSGGNVAEQQAALQRAASRLAAFDTGVVLLDSYGTVRATMPERPQLLLQDWSHHRFFQELLASTEVAFSDGVHEGPSPSMVTIIGVRILNDRGQFAGVLAGMFGLGKSTASSFYASIVRLRIGQSGTTYVVDSNGRILYDSSYAQVGAIFDARGLPAGALQGIGGANQTYDSPGRSMVSAYAPVPGTGWTLITEEDWATVTHDTRRYLDVLLILLAAGMTLPATGATLLMRQSHTDAQAQEQLAQARQVAGLAREALVPKHLPLLPGWKLAANHGPAGAICGMFYDYLFLPDGRLMLAIVQVHDPSAYAAFLAATARAVLRHTARQLVPPSAALSQVNDSVCPEVSEGHTVTCLYAILDPGSGRLELAHAGDALAHHLCSNGPAPLEPPGPPLGLRLDAQYHQSEVRLEPGEALLLAAGGPARRSGQTESRLEAVQALLDRAAGIAAPRPEASVHEGQSQDGSTVLLLERTGDALEQPPLTREAS
ncbi:MAG: SpoIIE family protein phosphatase [Anaerolineae bacterium]|nr:SpoIIE family protein phosphatase [Anaerolineae bacterium]